MLHQKQKKVFIHDQKSQFLTFSKTELEVISQLGNGNNEVLKIAEILKISQSQVYRIGQTLNKKSILVLDNGILLPEMKTHVSLLLKIMAKTVNLAVPLSGTGIKIYLTLMEPKKISDIEKETGLHKTTIIKKIKQGRKMSLLLVDKKTYRVNDKLWQDLKEYLLELKRYEEVLDIRVPVNSIIYYKNDSEILFSNKEEIDAEKTAFSAYEQYGIKILGITYFYYLPKRNLSKEEVFFHSLYVTEKEKEMRNIIFIALFLAKFKKELLQIEHPIVINLLKIFAGDTIKDYPTLQEIKDRAEIYGIEV